MKFALQGYLGPGSRAWRRSAGMTPECVAGSVRSDLENLPRRLVQALGRSVAAGEEIVAYGGEQRRGQHARMDADVHARRDGHALVVADQRALDRLVALAVAVQARLVRPAAAAHE